MSAETDIAEALLAALGLADDASEQEAKVLLDGCACNGEEGTLHLIWHLSQQAARGREAGGRIKRAESALEALGRERNTWASELAAAQGERDDERDRADTEESERRRIDTERTTESLRADDAEAALVALRETVEVDLPNALKGRLQEHVDGDCPVCNHGALGQMEQMLDDEMNAREAAEGRADKAESEVARLHSWDGLLGLLDEHWPEDIFPTLNDDATRDPGPRIASLLRWVARLRGMEAQVKALAEVAIYRESASPARTFDGGSFGAWIDAHALRAVLRGELLMAGVGETLAEVNDLARALMAEWERVEGEPVGVSRVAIFATFADLARVALRHRERAVAALRAATEEESARPSSP